MYQSYCTHGHPKKKLLMNWTAVVSATAKTFFHAGVAQSTLRNCTFLHVGSLMKTPSYAGAVALMVMLIDWYVFRHGS